MNKIVVVSAAAAVPTVAPAMVPSAPPFDDSDASLVEALRGLIAADEDIECFLKQHGDAADEMDERWKLEERRNECIATLVEIPSSSMAGVEAKAQALRLERMVEDWDQHQQIAVSLADDVCALPGASFSSDTNATEREIYHAGRAFEHAKAQMLAADKQAEQLEEQYADEFGAMLKNRGLPATFEECKELRKIEEWLQARSDAVPGLDELQDLAEHALPDEAFYAVGRAPTRTIAGLLIKARVAAWACCEYWDEPCEDLDWGPKNTRMLIESIFAAADAGRVENYLSAAVTRA